jgi:hypothetical protein
MKKTYRGSCHCGAVRFEADVDLSQGTAKCNCSICFKTRAWMAFIPADSFRLLAGEQSLRDYLFGKKVLHHRFCEQCGVRPFTHGIDPKGNRMYAIKVNCLDGVEASELAAAPVQFMDMLHDKFKPAPEETRHL